MFYTVKEELSLLPILFTRSNFSPTPCIAPYIPYQVAISAQNSNPVSGEVNSAIAFSREGSEFVLSSVSQSHCN